MNQWENGLCHQSGSQPSDHFTDLRLVTFLGHADVSGGRRLHPAAHLSWFLQWTLAGRPAPEHLLVGVPEVLGQEGVDDGVDGGVAVGQAVSNHPEDKGGLVQGEGAELHPQVDDVVRQPGQAEDHHHHQDGLSGLWKDEHRGAEGAETHQVFTKGRLLKCSF